MKINLETGKISKTKYKVVYNILKEVHLHLMELEEEQKIFSAKLNTLYRMIKNPEALEYIDDSMDEDIVECLIVGTQYQLGQAENEMEKLYNIWKSDHWGQELFTKIDSQLYKVEYIEED